MRELSHDRTRHFRPNLGSWDRLRMRVRRRGSQKWGTAAPEAEPADVRDPRTHSGAWGGGIKLSKGAGGGNGGPNHQICNAEGKGGAAKRGVFDIVRNRTRSRAPSRTRQQKRVPLSLAILAMPSRHPPPQCGGVRTTRPPCSMKAMQSSGPSPIGGVLLGEPFHRSANPTLDHPFTIHHRKSNVVDAAAESNWSGDAAEDHGIVQSIVGDRPNQDISGAFGIGHGHPVTFG